MKRKYGTIGMLSLLLCACAGKNPTLSSSAPISLSSDSASSSVSSDLSLPSPSSSVFSETVSSLSSGTKEEEPIVSLALAKKTALEGQDRVNDVGVYESDRKAELEVRLLASLDAITTKAGYGNRYKLLVANDEGSLYLKVGAEIYNRLKSQSGSCYRVRGTVSLYCGEAEITVDEMPEKIEDRAYSIDFEERTIEEIYTHLSQVTTNTKGCGFSSLTSFQGKYLGAMDDAVLLFYDGDKIVQVHGDSKVKNGLNENEVYRIFGAMTMFNYKPGVEYVSSERIQSGEEYAIDPTKLETIDRNCYSTYYEVDREDSYPEYSSFYQELKVFRGYVNLYYKNAGEYMVLDTAYQEEYYSTYSAASKEKALFLHNDSCVNLTTEKDRLACPLYEFVDRDAYVEMVVAPYLWNTQKYWQVFVLEDTIREIVQ